MEFPAQSMEREDADSGGRMEIILAAQVRLVKDWNLCAGAEIGSRRRKSRPAAFALDPKFRFAVAHDYEIDFAPVYIP